jgi:hypothetical protein
MFSFVAALISVITVKDAIALSEIPTQKLFTEIKSQ